MAYFKDFDRWIEKKKQVDASMAKPPLFKERDIWWVSVGVNVGFEEDGKNDHFVRPVVVVKKFSRDLFFGLPMSKKIKSNKYYFRVSMGAEDVSVLMSQMRVFSSKRMWNKLGELDEGDFNDLINYLRGEILPPPKRGRG